VEDLPEVRDHGGHAARAEPRRPEHGPHPSRRPPRRPGSGVELVARAGPAALADYPVRAAHQRAGPQFCAGRDSAVHQEILNQYGFDPRMLSG
jgi:hypothetical protein